MGSLHSLHLRDNQSTISSQSDIVVMFEGKYSCQLRSVLMIQSVPGERRLAAWRPWCSLQASIKLDEVYFSQLLQDLLMLPSVAPLGRCGHTRWKHLLKASFSGVREGAVLFINFHHPNHQWKLNYGHEVDLMSTVALAWLAHFSATYSLTSAAFSLCCALCCWYSVYSFSEIPVVHHSNCYGRCCY